jgi:hypothetical protein
MSFTIVLEWKPTCDDDLYSTLLSCAQRRRWTARRNADVKIETFNRRLRGAGVLSTKNQEASYFEGIE